MTDPRAAFEEWADALPECLPPAPKAAAWKAWQAAIKHEREQIAAFIESEAMADLQLAAECERKEIAAAVRERSA